MELRLRISGIHYEVLRKHLLAPDGKEAVAVALCGRHNGSEAQTLIIHEITLIPYDECSTREEDLLTWSTKCIEGYFERISNTNLAILKIHSHPNGYNWFSRTDDRSDEEFFNSIFGWATTSLPHASAVMLPDGEIFGRFFYDDLTSVQIDKISIAGDSVQIFNKNKLHNNPSFAQRTIQTFGEKTYSLLNSLSVGVVGCSGTGSPLIEQLVRLGIGYLVLIDPDTVEDKNLNRILNSTKEDALMKRKKVDVLSTSINRIGLGTEVTTFTNNLYDNASPLQTLASCDVIFGCMDSVDGRHLLNQLCSFYAIPYIDLGVKLEADGNGGIKKICGSVHYLQPGKSSLLSRGLYTTDDLRAASQYRKNEDEYHSLQKNSYIKNVNINSPAVISVNMQIASHAVNEFLNRIHTYKTEDPINYAASTIDITESYIVNINENDFPIDNFLVKKVGKGDVLPFIEMPDIG